VTFERDEQFAKDDLPRVLSVAGSETVSSEIHSENASSSIMPSWESGSNAKFERDRHLRKHDLEITLTEEGMQMDFSEDSKNASESIRSSLDPGSNTMCERKRQPAKHDWLKTFNSWSMCKSGDNPNERITATKAESTRRRPKTQRNGFAASTATCVICVPANAEPCIFVSDDGSETEFRSRQPEKAPASIV
jgi:hypothetical protein